jgi:hypothetical protein
MMAQVIATAPEKIANCQKSARKSRRRTADDEWLERFQLHPIRATVAQLF